MGKIFTDATGQQILAALLAQNENLNNWHGTLSSLATSNKTSLVAAINELLGNQGGISSLSTTAKSNLVSAINEIYDFSKVLKESSGAGLHNSIFRGKSLGSSLTSAQSAAIRAGTFDDVFVGDYWPIAVPAYSWTDTSNVVHNESAASVVFRVADCDYYLHTGDTECTTHHVVVVPDTILYTARMNATDTTEGAYVGSEMYKNNLRRAKALFTAAFGSGHILTHREYLQNAVTNGICSAGAWYDSTVELMTEPMVYGGFAFDSSSPDGTGGTAIASTFNRHTVGKSQLSLFRLRHDLMIAGTGSSRAWWWLRNVVSAACFAYVGNYGNCGCPTASHAGGGVRPAALIY